MNRSFLFFLQVFFVMLDLLVLNLIYALVQPFFGGATVDIDPVAKSQQWLTLNGFWILVSWFGSVYAENSIYYSDVFIKKSLRSFFLWALLILIYVFLPHRVSLTRSEVLITVGCFFVGLLINRFLYYFIREWVKRKVHLNRRVLILGYNSLSKQLTTYLNKEEFGIQIMGYVDDMPAKEDHAGYPLFPNIENALALSKELKINELYTTIMPENNTKVYKLMQEADKELIRFRIVPDFSYLVNRPVFIDYLRDLPILTVRREPLEDVMSRFLKRSFDIVVSALVLLFVMSWLVPILGLLIYLESPGPIFFSQLRSGKNNVPFKCYKFRSMRPNKEANSRQATKNDNRVTRIGRIIRKTSLDEFPQFFNVLLGDMSIVGPRPHMLKHTEEYSLQAEDYMIRQFLKPGITGWAQVNGYRGEITELSHIKKRVEYDLWYLENWSLWLDIKIMILTVYNVFKGEKNAY